MAVSDQIKHWRNAGGLFFHTLRSLDVEFRIYRYQRWTLFQHGGHPQCLKKAPELSFVRKRVGSRRPENVLHVALLILLYACFKACSS